MNSLCNGSGDSDSDEHCELPTVGVVVATRNRPELVRRALESIRTQDYSGFIEVVLVFDRSERDESLAQPSGNRRVRLLRNQRTPGLAGARNTGILQLDTDLVAFCDDDDVWLPGKLAAQVARLRARPEAEFVTTAMRVDVAGQSTVRSAGRSQVTLQDLIRSRMAMLHSSSFLFRRTAMLEGFGLVDETLPQSMGEDWDLLLRAARRRPVEHVDEALVGVLWGATSYFNDAWRDKNAAHEWLLDHHPEIRRDPVGLALMYGKLAFGYALLGNRALACRYAWRTARTRWQEPRSALAMLAVLGVPGAWIQRMLNRRGYGV